MGQLARKAVVFELTGEKILDANDKVGNKHISQVQKIVQKKLESVENELKDKRAQELEAIKMEAGKVKAEADLQMEGPALAAGGPDLRLRQPVLAAAR